jgi:hypothetical protein
MDKLALTMAELMSRHGSVAILQAMSQVCAVNAECDAHAPFGALAARQNKLHSNWLDMWAQCLAANTRRKRCDL